MQDIAQLVDKQITETSFVCRRRALRYDGGGRTRFARLDRRRVREDPVAALVPRSARVDLAMVACAGGIVEELVDEAGRRGEAADAERRLAHAFERQRERLHVRDLAGHQELQRVLAAGVIAEIDQPLVDDLGPRLRGDVAAQIDVELAGDLQIVGGPGISLGVEEIDPTAARDRDQGVGFGRLAVELRRLEMHPRQRADHLQMAELLGADVHQQVLAIGIFAVQPLYRVLHGGREFAIGAAELLKQHVAKAGIRLVHPNGEHQLLDVVIHGGTFGFEGQEKKMLSERAASRFVPIETICAGGVRRRSFDVVGGRIARALSALIRTLGGLRPALVARCALNIRRVLRLHGGVAGGVRRTRSDGFTGLGGRTVLVAGLSGNAGP
ncbi:hypothetical protein ACVW0I_006681 [Bradyrhizobium sp. LM6.11]